MGSTRPAVNLTIPFFLVLACLLAGCAAPEAEEARTFLLRTDNPDILQLSTQLIEGLSLNLAASGSLGEGYPQMGQVEAEPDPANPGMQNLRCAPAEAAGSPPADCLLLNEHDDFVRAQAITWESAVFSMYRVYVAPRNGLARVNPVRDYVALDIMVFEEQDLWEAIDEAIRESAVGIGARPFQP